MEGRRLPRAAVVLNKAPAEKQITANQLLREAAEHRDQVVIPTQTQVVDVEELADYRLQKRKQFEDQVRRSRFAIGVWIKYALWETMQKEFDRARSVFERGIDVDYRNVGLWLKYAEMEMKNGFVNRARNVWDRAVQLMPREDQLWLKYSLMEEQLENYKEAKQVFERWMQWAPDARAWEAYIQLEIRYKQFDQVRDIYERFLLCHPYPKTYLKYAGFEEKHGTREAARSIYERCVDELGERSYDLEFFIGFTKFEERNKELERVKVIFQFGIDKMREKLEQGEDERSVAENAAELFRRFTIFQKQFGDLQSIDEAVLNKRRLQYEEELKSNRMNYDVWFDYINLEQSALAASSSEARINQVREIFERAISNVPPANEKRFWRRYIYLWINYVVFEELEAKDIARCRQVYKACLDLIPHKSFTFAKIWVMFAHFEVRNFNLSDARKILGTAIGQCPTKKLFKKYIDMELTLGDIDRCRTLYQKFLETMPDNSEAWCNFADLENSLGETDRARAIFELAIDQETMDAGEVVWKTYIDFELELGEVDAARELYSRLLDKSKHVKVWISRAQFEADIGQLDLARAAFAEAENYFKAESLKEERVIILEAWYEFEKRFGDSESQSRLQGKLPQRVKRKRALYGSDGSEIGVEEYFDYTFPEEVSVAPGLRLLQAAKQWKSKVSTVDQ